MIDLAIFTLLNITLFILAGALILAITGGKDESGR